MRTAFQKVCTVGLAALAGLAGSAVGLQPGAGGVGGTTGGVADGTTTGTNVVNVVAPLSAAAEELLTKLENADKALTTLRCNIRLIKNFPKFQGGGSRTQYGELFFEQKMNPEGGEGLGNGKEEQGAGGAGSPQFMRKFAILFSAVMIDNKQRTEREDAVFDGQWLLERKEQDKQFVRRRLAPPGSNVDPMRIGEGPYPLPIGQRKADLVGTFVVEVVDSLDTVAANKNLEDYLRGTYQLKLVPRVGSAPARQFSEIRLWYRTSDLLPVFARATNTDTSTNEVMLLDLKAGQAIDAKVFDTTPPSKESGWVGNVVEFREQ